MRLPRPWILCIAAALGVATIIVTSAYGLEPRPAAYAGACVALLILAWGWLRDR